MDLVNAASSSYSKTEGAEKSFDLIPSSSPSSLHCSISVFTDTYDESILALICWLGCSRALGSDTFFFWLVSMSACVLMRCVACLLHLPPLSLSFSLSQTHYASLFPLFFLSHAAIVIAYGFRKRTQCPGLHVHGEHPRVCASLLSAHSPGYAGVISIKGSLWKKGGWQLLILISL